jgi:hypothetical protein
LPLPGRPLHGRALRGRERREHARGRIDEERDPAITQDGRTEVALETGQERAEGLDHDLFLSQERVTGHDGPAAGDRDDERRRLVAQRWRSGADERSEVSHRH